MFSCARGVARFDRDIREGRWQKRTGILVQGKTVGFIGFGRIGKRAAGLFSALGCKIVYCDPFVKDKTFSKKEMDDLVRISDIVVLTAEAKETIITKELLSRFKEKAILINTARGSLIDENALYDALKSEKLFAAGVDVFENEPYEGKLVGLKDIVLTPHIGSYAKETRMRMEKEAVQNLIKGFSGEESGA